MESNAHIVEYWKTQPEVLEACLKNSLPLTENFVKLYQEVRPTHLYLVGSGTSLNAEETAVSFMKEMLDIDVISMPSSYVHDIRGDRPMFVFLSQGGSSTNTLKAMEETAAYPFITRLRPEVPAIWSSDAGKSRWDRRPWAIRHRL